MPTCGWCGMDQAFSRPEKHAWFQVRTYHPARVCSTTTVTRDAGNREDVRSSRETGGCWQSRTRTRPRRALLVAAVYCKRPAGPGL